MNQTVVSQEFASLSCEATGVPRPTITWYKTVAGMTRMSVLQDSDTIITQEVVDNRTQRSVLQVNLLSHLTMFSTHVWHGILQDQMRVQPSSLYWVRTDLLHSL